MNSQFYDPKASFSQSYLLSRIVRNAQRPKKIPFFIRENWLNTLRWSERFSVNLQISGAPFSFSLEGEGQGEGVRQSDSPSSLPSPASGRRKRFDTDIESICKAFDFFSIGER